MAKRKNFSQWSGEPWFEHISSGRWLDCDICGYPIRGPATVRMRVVGIEQRAGGTPLGYLRIEHRNGPTLDVIESVAEAHRRRRAAGFQRCPA